MINLLDKIKEDLRATYPELIPIATIAKEVYGIKLCTFNSKVSKGEIFLPVIKIGKNRFVALEVLAKHQHQEIIQSVKSYEKLK